MSRMEFQRAVITLTAPWIRFLRLRSMGRARLAAAWAQPPCCPAAAQARHIH